MIDVLSVAQGVAQVQQQLLGEDLTALVQGNRSALESFMNRLGNGALVSDVELIAKCDGDETPLRFFASPVTDRFVIVAGTALEDVLLLLLDRTVRADPERDDLLQGFNKAFLLQPNFATSEATVFDEISRLNNDIVNKSRELSKNNFELLMEKERNRVTIASIGDGVVATDVHGRITSINAIAEELTGWCADDAIGMDVADVVGFLDEAGQSLHGLFSISLLESRKSALPVISMLLRRDGMSIPVDDSIAPIRDRNGKTIGLVITFRDITERRMAEATLRDSEEEIRLLLNSAAEAIYGLDLNGNCTFCNRSCLHLLGYDRPEDLLGKNMHWLIHGKHADGSRYEVEDCRIFKALVDGRNAHLDDEVLWRSDGTSFPAEYWSYPKVREGRLVGAVVSFLDITNRKRAEEALRKSEARFREIFNSVNDAIHLNEIGPDFGPGALVDVNEVGCRMLGYSREEMMGMTPMDFSTEHHVPALAEILQQLREGAAVRFETEHRRRDGSTFPVEVNAHTVAIMGKPMILAVVRDMTERKQVEEALLRTSKKLSLLNSITRHDILNQTVVIDGYADLARHRPEGAALRPFLDKISAASGSIGKQIRFTRDYQELGIKKPEWFDPGELFEECFRTLKPPGVDWLDHLGGYEVLADPMIEKVFYNLIDNSMRHGGCIRVLRLSAHEEAGHLLLVYEDDGVGIAEADRERLFQKGFGKNTGLGLFLSREILAITGMTIEEKGEEGKGARFVMDVPPGHFRRTGDRSAPGP